MQTIKEAQQHLFKVAQDRSPQPSIRDAIKCWKKDLASSLPSGLDNIKAAVLHWNGAVLSMIVRALQIAIHCDAYLERHICKQASCSSTDEWIESCIEEYEKKYLSRNTKLILGRHKEAFVLTMNTTFFMAGFLASEQLLTEEDSPEYRIAAMDFAVYLMEGAVVFGPCVSHAARQQYAAEQNVQEMTPTELFLQPFLWAIDNGQLSAMIKE